MTATTGRTVAQNIIGNRRVGGVDNRTSIDPATGNVIGYYAHATQADVNDAIAAARDAFATTSWRHDRRLRARALNAMADLVERHHAELVDLLSLDNGKTRAEAGFEIGLTPPKLRWWAAMCLADQGRAADTGAGRTSVLLREPVGVAGIVVPFNSPVILAVRSFGPALAAGTTAVIKFPVQTPLIAARFMEIIAETPELPPGVLNSVITDRGTAAALIESPDVPVLSFTGSTATGRAIAAKAAAHLKRVGLELGGKSPMIVFETADLAAAAPVLEKAVTTFAGQFCLAGTRILVQRRIADTLRTLLVERLSRVTVGPGSDPNSDMGPLIDRANVDRLETLVSQAITDGATALVRGGPPADPRLANGAYFAPTLLEVTDTAAPVVQQELFGPIATLEVFDTENDAIALANATEYGLAASIWSGDVDQPWRVACQLDAGTIWINDWGTAPDEFEEGGFKQSGLGRLNGYAALDEFIEYKHIAIAPRPA